MSDKNLTKLNGKEEALVSGGEKVEESSQSIKEGTCVCGYEKNLKDVPKEKTAILPGVKKEWVCPKCGRYNVERKLKIDNIFEVEK
mgnify:FL=1